MILEEGDIVLLQNFNHRTKIDNRGYNSPYILVSQPDNAIPVGVVNEISSRKKETCHRNQILPLFQSVQTC